MILKGGKERERFLKFMVVGTIGAVVDLGIFNVLSSLFGVQAIIAQAISFSMAVVSNFLWNRYWTYPDSRNKPVANQLGQFIIVSVIGLTIRTLIFDRLEEGMIWAASQVMPKNFFLSPTIIGHNLSLATVILIIMLWNFFVNRYWTYNDVS
jgi:putative flippase GtrA